MIILGAPILKAPVIDKVLLEKVEDPERAIQRLTLSHYHDTLCLMQNAFAMPKVLYVLCTAP